MNITTLAKTIRDANKAYRTGSAIMSDEKYDELMDELKSLDPHHPLLKAVGYAGNGDSRLEKLPVEMASLDKVKSVAEIKQWMLLKKITFDAKLVLTPKYDGLSLLIDEANDSAWTRGDGIEGQRSDKHFRLLKTKSGLKKGYTIGEVVMRKDTFEEKYADQFANPRNLVAGKMNEKKPSEILQDCYLLRYGYLERGASKSEQMEVANLCNSYKIPYIVTTVGKLDDDYMLKLYKAWSEDFIIDGIVVDVESAILRRNLGTERSGNPVYARAYKGNFEEVKKTTVTGITWQVSKHGLLKPVLQVNPVKLDGATVTNVTGNNAKNVMVLGLGKGAVITLKRSGQVIPMVVDVIKKAQTTITTVCPSCGGKVKWNDTGVELVCTNKNCSSQDIEKLIAFFKHMGVDEVGEGICKMLWADNRNTVAKVLALSEKAFALLPGFGERKAHKVYENIHSKMQNVPLHRVMHASSCFTGLGSTKLALVEHLYEEVINARSWDDIYAVGEKIMQVEGFSKKSADEFINGCERFTKFFIGLPITIAKAKKVKAVGSKCAGFSVCFTGFRSAEMEQAIVEQGGKIASGVSKNTTHLVMKRVGSGSSKERKAQELGIEVWDEVRMNKYLGRRA